VCYGWSDAKKKRGNHLLRRGFNSNTDPRESPKGINLERKEGFGGNQGFLGKLLYLKGEPTVMSQHKDSP